LIAIINCPKIMVLNIVVLAFYHSKKDQAHQTGSPSNHASLQSSLSSRTILISCIVPHPPENNKTPCEKNQGEAK
jgi:hypothetical protein